MRWRRRAVAAWRTKLEALVGEARSRPRPPDQLVEACLRHAAQCDPYDSESLIAALEELLLLAEHLWVPTDGGSRGENPGEPPLALAMDLALASYEATGEPDFVVGFSRHLNDLGLTGSAVDVVDRALGAEVPRAQAGGVRHRSVLSRLQGHRGELLRQVGELAAAEVAFRTSLDLLEGDTREAEEGRAAVLNNLGLVHLELGDLFEAKQCLVQSLEIDERLGTGPLELAVGFDNLGGIELRLAAEAGPLHPAEGYVNEPTERHLSQAEELFASAREHFEAALPASAEHYVRSLLNSAEAAVQRGDRAALERFSRRAHEVSRLPAVTAATALHAISLRGEVLLGQDRPQECADLLVPWLAEVMNAAPHHRPVGGLVTLLRAAGSLDDRTLVTRAASAIAATDDEMLARKTVAASEQDARHLFGEFGDRTELVLGYCLPQAATGTVPDWLYEVHLNRKGILAERQGSAWLRARAADGAGPELLARVRRLRTEAARLDLDGSGAGADTITAARRRHADAQRALVQAERELHRALGNARLPRVSLAAVRGGLTADTTLLDFALVQRPDGTRRSVVFHVRADGEVRFRDLGPLAEVERRLGLLQAEFTQPAKPPTERSDWAPTVRNLVPPLFGPQDVITDSVLFAPTALWGFAPFALLPGPDGVPLIETRRIGLIPSARWLVTHTADAAAAAGTVPPGPPLVIGDPDFDLRFSEQISFYLSRYHEPLAHAAAETEDVGARLGVEPVVQKAATRGALLGARRPRILHIATHGTFLDAIGSLAERSEPQAYVTRAVGGTVVTTEEDLLGWTSAGSGAAPPDARTAHKARVRWLWEVGPAAQQSRSGLLLTGVNAWLAGVDTPEDVGSGMISAAEFALLDLTGTELVVLSACETGVGAIDHADGSVLGLRTAALAAGAQTCVSSLWKVNDEATTALMSTFYEELARGRPASEALRAAQRTLRATHPDPYYWAAWIAEGIDTP